jgi:hypothetical protein
VVLDGISQLSSTDGLSHLVGVLNLAGGAAGIAIGLWAVAQGWHRYRRPGGVRGLAVSGVAVLATTLYVTFATGDPNVVVVLAAVTSAAGLLLLALDRVQAKA